MLNSPHLFQIHYFYKFAAFVSYNKEPHQRLQLRNNSVFQQTAPWWFQMPLEIALYFYHLTSLQPKSDMSDLILDSCSLGYNISQWFLFFPYFLYVSIFPLFLIFWIDTKFFKSHKYNSYTFKIKYDLFYVRVFKSKFHLTQRYKPL